MRGEGRCRLRLGVPVLSKWSIGAELFVVLSCALCRRPPVTEEGHSHHNCCTHNRSTSATSATNAEGSKKRPARQEEEDEEGEEGGAPMTMKEFLTQMDRLETLAKEHDSEVRAHIHTQTQTHTKRWAVRGLALS